MSLIRPNEIFSQALDGMGTLPFDFENPMYTKFRSLDNRHSGGNGHFGSVD